MKRTDFSSNEALNASENDALEDSAAPSEMSEIGKLIAMKRYEQPEEGFEAYTESFITDLHRRQRSDLLRQSARGLFMERMSTFFEGFSTLRLAGAAGAACLAIAVVIPFLQGGTEASNQVANPSAPSASQGMPYGMPAVFAGKHDQPQLVPTQGIQGAPGSTAVHGSELGKPIYHGKIREF